MDTSAIASAATDMSAARTQDAVSVTVLKKSMDIAAESAAALIGSVSTPYPVANVGQHINTTA